MKEIILGGQRIKVISSVDAVGLFCPLPIVKLKVEMERAKTNQVVELLADDPGVLEDLPAWCRETDNTLLSLEKNEEGIFVGYVRKRK